MKYHKLIENAAKPEGFWGKLMLRSMNKGHHALTDWALAYVDPKNGCRALDIGCGGGRNAAELLKRYPDSKVTAIDYSPLSVEQATAYNKEAISAGRCIVQQGDVSSLPLDDGIYDLATAFETIYFWQGLEKCFSEVFRVLKPSGCFMIVNESDGLDENSKKYEKMIDGMKLYTAEDIEKALKSAGFSAVKTYHYEGKPWIAVLAQK